MDENQLPERRVERDTSFDTDCGVDDWGWAPLAVTSTATTPEQHPAHVGTRDHHEDEDSMGEPCLPAQLHPAVSLGMRRASSYYFSVGGGDLSEATNSVADLLSLLDATEDGKFKTEEVSGRGPRCYPKDIFIETVDENDNDSPMKWNASEILYHDIMMNVLTFFDATDLRNFSETARRPNYECFYFLQLQLQRALLGVAKEDELNSDTGFGGSPSSSVLLLAGSGSIARLARTNSDQAKAIVQEYLDSNSSLRVMPLSHSLAYVRHVLRRYGFLNHVSTGSPSHSLGRAALIITLMGAATSYMGSSSTVVSAPEAFTIFRVGLAGSALMGAASKMNQQEDQQHAPRTMRELAEQMAHMMQEMPSRMMEQVGAANMASSSSHEEDDVPQRESQPQQESFMNFPSSIASRLYTAFSSAYGKGHQEGAVAADDSTDTQPNLRRKRRGKHVRDSTQHNPNSVAVVHEDDKADHSNDDDDTAFQRKAMQKPITPDPYEHLKHPQTEEDDGEGELLGDREGQWRRLLTSNSSPTGCVGAYARAVRKASATVKDQVLTERSRNFDALPMDEQFEISRLFLEACSSDDSLGTVKELVQQRKLVNVNTFLIGADGNQTCALHTAAFHGACRVLEFLCEGLDERYPSKDGGLALVNIKDANGWTALHFAAGANSVEAVRILARNGAQLAVEAGNGYTPFHWAQRLSNHEVAKELEQLGADQRFHLEIGKELSAMAGRFFSMIPSGTATAVN